MNLLAQSGPTTLVLLLLLVLVIGWVLFRTHRAVARQRNLATWVKTPRPRAPDQHLDAPADVARWEVKMHETARALSAQLDSKMGALRALLAEADRAAARLEGALAQATPPSEDSTPPPHQTTQAESLLASPPSQETPPSPAAADPPSAGHHQEEVYTLADYGFPAAEIARRIGRPIGEVELILSLRRKR